MAACNNGLGGGGSGGSGRNRTDGESSSSGSSGSSSGISGGSAGGWGGSGTISISTPGGTGIIGSLSYNITISGNGQTIQRTARAGSSIKETVSAGYWTISATAYYQGAIYATGSVSVNVQAGKNSPANLQMNLVSGGPSGPTGPTTYTVTFYADGGTPAPVNTTVIHGGSIIEPDPMTKTGHAFDDWYTDSGFTTAASFPITFTANVSLYAQWTPIIVSITTHPASPTVSQGSISGSLSVNASMNPPAGTGHSQTLSYQWYSNTSASNIGGTGISGATGASFAIPTTLTAAGSPYYYFCEVSTDGVSPVRSNPATVQVIPNINDTLRVTITIAPDFAGAYTNTITITISSKAGYTLPASGYNNSWNTVSGGIGGPYSFSGTSTSMVGINTSMAGAPTVTVRHPNFGGQINFTASSGNPGTYTSP